VQPAQGDHHEHVPRQRSTLKPTDRARLAATPLSVTIYGIRIMSASQSITLPALRLNNVALAVADLDAMVGWYQNAFGLRVEERGYFDPVNAEFVMLTGAGFRLELVSRADGDHRPADRSAPPQHLNALGWKAIVLETDDLTAMTAALTAQSVEIVWAERQLTPTLASTMVRDPEGNLVNIFGVPRLPRLGTLG
jgi:catechol 2,3-dioxygenase-like lactoylglutathione lyase family enzyme